MKIGYIRKIGECEPWGGMICRRFYPGLSACTAFGGEAKCLQPKSNPESSSQSVNNSDVMRTFSQNS